jgi:hypothetical protein
MNVVEAFALRDTKGYEANLNAKGGGFGENIYIYYNIKLIPLDNSYLRRGVLYLQKVTRAN